MTSVLISCVEEEFSPFFSLLWRWRRGWRPVFFALRGPGGMWPPLGLVLTFLGIWRFSRTPRSFLPLASEFRGRSVTHVHSHLGSYGMGGPGFLGLRLGGDWIVYRLWAAASWLTLDGSLLEEAYFPDERVPERTYVSITSIIGAAFEEAIVTDEHLVLVFSKQGKRSQLELRRDGSSVPRFPGNGELKQVEPSTALREVTSLSRVARLWLD